QGLVDVDVADGHVTAWRSGISGHHAREISWLATLIQNHLNSYFPERWTKFYADDYLVEMNDGQDSQQ
ncbi:hypothetical protein, partial [Modicisalibacter zincidurans]|uniref:hypothetical protein n=1 Tax=Modicisalibacter zincidurans TaxID=1178777 RepID=UPI0031F0C610